MTSELRKIWDEQAAIIQQGPILGRSPYLPGMRLLQATRNTGARGVVWLAKGDYAIGYQSGETPVQYSVFSPRPIWNPNHGECPKGLEKAIIGWCRLPSISAVKWVVPEAQYRIRRSPAKPDGIGTYDVYIGDAANINPIKTGLSLPDAIVAAFGLNYPITQE